LKTRIEELKSKGEKQDADGGVDLVPESESTIFVIFQLVRT